MEEYEIFRRLGYQWNLLKYGNDRIPPGRLLLITVPSLNNASAHRVVVDTRSETEMECGVVFDPNEPTSDIHYSGRVEDKINVYFNTVEFFTF